MIKKYIKPTLFATGFALFLLFLGQTGSQKQLMQEEQLGASYPNASWTIIDRFNGYQTKSDPTKVADGANPMGQNTTPNNGDRISIRSQGYELFPDTDTASTTESPVTSVHTFRKRNGDNIMLRSYGTVLEYFEEGNDEWTTLKTGLSDGAEFDFADYNINTDLQSYVYFGNAVDDFARWSGSHTTLTTALAVDDSYIYVDSVDGFLLANATTTVCGVELAYTSASTTLNRFELTASSTISCTNGSGVAEGIQTYAANPKGNIYLVNNNRLFIAGISSTTQAIYFSEYGDATNFVGADLITDSTATAPGIFNLGEGGGAVIGMAVDEESIYFFKKSTIRKATLNDTLYTLSDLKPSDGKSQTIGAVNNKSVFSGGNAIYIISPDNKILSLGRVENYDYPQASSISDSISPTADNIDFSDSAGIVYRDKAYFAVKSSPDVISNDTVLAWDIDNKTWDSPIVGWNVSDFVVYDDGDGEDLYFADTISPNVYKVINDAQDGIYEVVANWRSKQYAFNTPHAQKEIVDMFIEGYIAQNTTLTITLLLDEDGYTGNYSTEITGADSDYIYDSTVYNALGLTAFGTERFGSQDDLSGKKKFRVYLGKEFRPAPFYTAQVDFASDGESQDWEVLSFGIKARPYTVPERRDLYKAFK